MTMNIHYEWKYLVIISITIFVLSLEPELEEHKVLKVGGTRTPTLPR